MRRNYRILIPFIILGLLAIPSYFAKMRTYENLDMSAIPYADFEENQVWKGEVLVANQHLFACSDLIYYANLEKGISQPLCSIPDCLHNTEDCMAQFSFTFMHQFLYCFDGKLYVGGSEGNDLCFYRCDIDGSNHEKVSAVSMDGELGLTNFYVHDSCVYITTVIPDNSKVKVLENGFMTDAPSTAELWCYDLETLQFEHIYTFSQVAYQINLNVRYIRDGKCYYEYAGQELPQEELYDLETGEIIDPEYEKYEFEEVGVIDLTTRQREITEDYQFGDYIGCREGMYYYTARDVYGDIRVEDYVNGTEERIHISEMEGENFWNCSVFLTGDGLVVNEQKWMADTGRILFYDRNGNQTYVMENSSMFIIGDYQNFYLLNSNSVNTVEAYVLKEDIDKINKKTVYLWKEE